MTVLVRDPRGGFCQATVWVKDTYRRTGRTKSGFEMHYNKRQCRRKATHGNLCFQHQEPGAFAPSTGVTKDG